MADKQISDLTAASALDGTELVHIVQGGNSRKATVADISRTAISGQYLLGNGAGGATSTSAYATKGTIAAAIYDCVIRSAAFYVDSAPGGTYKAVIAKLNSSNVITEILATSSVIAAPSSGTTSILFEFSTPAIIAAGDRIALMLVRTDGTSTTACETSFFTTKWALLDLFPMTFTYVGAVRYASTDPAISDNVFYSDTDHVPVKILC